VAECPHPTKGNVRELAHLVRVGGSTVVPHRLAPDLGQHSEPILASLGYDAAEIAALRDSGAVYS
jgi:crotonobetainyl-CoA:carnitine CoA-transferase CaiB-like acyl-CoA transferase